MVRVGGGLEPLVEYLDRQGARFERLLKSEMERLNICMQELVDKLVRGERTKHASESSSPTKSRPKGVVKRVQVDLRKKDENPSQRSNKKIGHRRDSSISSSSNLSSRSK